MYCEFFGLRCRPFEDRADTRFLFATGDVEETLAAMEYEVCDRRGAAMVLGEAGTGKTLLVRALLQRLCSSDDAVVLTWPTSGLPDLIREAAKSFGVSLPGDGKDARLARRFQRALRRRLDTRRRSILIIDQAENLSTDNLAQLATLAEWQHNSCSLLRIVVVAQPRIKRLLDRPEFSRFSQHLFGERMLRVFRAEETPAYVQHRLEVAGAEAGVFSDEALRIIHQASNGVPRLINHMCDAALLAAYGAEKSHITAALASEAIGHAAGARHTADISTVGVPCVEQVAAGLVKSDEHTMNMAGTATSIAPPSPPTVENEPMTSSPTTGWPGAGEHADALFASPDEAALVADRLKQTLRKAQGTSGTVQASLAQVTVVEKHLNMLVEGAQQLIPELSQAVQRATELLGQVEQRSTQRIHDLDLQAREVTELFSRHGNASEKMDEQTERVEAACNEAAEAEARLTALAERLADRVDEVHAQTTQLMSAVDTAEEAREALDETGRKAAPMGDEAAQVTARLREAVAEGKTEAQRIQTTLLDAALHTCRERLEAQLEAHLKKQTKVLDELYQSKAAALEDVTRRAEEAEKVLETLTQRRHGMSALVDKVNARVEELETRMAAAGTRVDDMSAGAEELINKAESTYTGLGGVVSRGESLGGELNALFGQVKDAQRSVSDILLNVGAAHERAQVVQQQVDHWKDVAAELSAGRQDGEKTAESLAAAAQQVREQVEVLDARTTELNERSETLEIQNAAAAELLDNLMRTGDSASKTVDELTHITNAGNRVLERAAQDIKTLHAKHERSAATAQQLEELTATAGQINETLQGAVAHADDKIGKLGSHHAAATHTLRNLADSTGTAQELARQVETARQSSTDTQERIERLIEDVWSMATRAEVNIKKLAAQNETAESLAGRVDAAVVPATELVKSLGDALTEAKAHHQTMSEHCKQAGALAQRLESIAKLMNEVKTTEDSMRDVMGQADTLHHQIKETVESAQQQLTQTLDSADNHGKRLDEALASAKEVLDQYGQIKKATDDAANRMTEQLASASNTIEAAEPLVKEFMTQAEGIEGQIDEMQARTANVEQRLTEAMSQSEQTVEGAQAQAAQLERVCGAVKKVFAGLSQAALEARQYAAECKTSSEVAREHLTEFRTQTDFAANTLNQWVEEAVRAQKRLEHTLAGVPSIRETHPTDGIRQIPGNSRPATLAPTDPTGRLKMLKNSPPPASAEAAKVIVEKTVPRTPAESDDIGRLIEDAKQAIAAS